MLRLADVKCKRHVAVAIANLLLSLSRHSCSDRAMVETLTIGEDEDWKSAECCHGDNYVPWRKLQSRGLRSRRLLADMGRILFAVRGVRGRGECGDVKKNRFGEGRRRSRRIATSIATSAFKDGRRRSLGATV